MHRSGQIPQGDEWNGGGITIDLSRMCRFGLNKELLCGDGFVAVSP